MPKHYVTRLHQQHITPTCFGQGFLTGTLATYRVSHSSCSPNFLIVHSKLSRDEFLAAFIDMCTCLTFDVVECRLPSRGSKNDTETDVRNLLEQILQGAALNHACVDESTTWHVFKQQLFVADICSLLSLPEWPAAATALLRLINTLGSTSGLYNNDNAVRQASVDMLGTIAARVFMEAYQGEKDEEYLRECLLQEVEGIDRTSSCISSTCRSGVVCRRLQMGEYGQVLGACLRLFSRPRLDCPVLLWLAPA